MKVGFQIGGLVEIGVSEKFSVQPELVFSTQGAKFEESLKDVKSELSKKLKKKEKICRAHFFGCKKNG